MALVSKDLRLRGLLLAAAWVAGLAIVLVSRHPRAFHVVACQLLLLFPPLVTLLANVSLLVGERASGLSPFLNALPVGRRRIWRTKLLLCFAHLLVVVVTTSVYTGWVSQWTWTNAQAYGYDARALQLVYESCVGGVLLALCVFGSSVWSCARASTPAGAVTGMALPSVVAFAVYTVASLHDVGLAAPAYFVELTQALSPFAASWLEIGELLLMAALLIPCGMRALGSTAEGEPKRRARRSGWSAAKALAIACLVLAPLNIAANRATPADVATIGSVKLSPDGRFAVCEPGIRRWGRYLMNRIALIDLQTGRLELIARGSETEWRGDGGAILFVRPRVFDRFFGPYQPPDPRRLVRRAATDDLRPERFAALASRFGRDHRHYLVRAFDRHTGRALFGRRTVGGSHGWYLVSAEGKQVWTHEDFGGQFPLVRHLHWAPGGLLVVDAEQLSDGSTRGRVWFLSTDRPEAKLLANAVPGGGARELQASTEGTWVSFFAEGEASQGSPLGRRNLYVRELQPPWRAHDAAARACTWARKNHRLFVLTTHNPPELHALNCDTGDWERLAVVQTLVARDTNMGPLSPDGKLLPLMLSGYRSEKRRWSPLHSGFRTTRSRELWVVDTERGAAQLLKEYPSLIRRVGDPQVPTDPQADMAWILGWAGERQLVLHEQGRRLVSLDVRSRGERRVYEAPRQGAPPLF
jgi:hypothetical protein